jgi:predicted NBD/HSP70 family sugar kinase
MYLLFDIGGTRARIAVANSLDAISKTKICDTPQDFEKGVELLKKEAAELLGGKKPTSVVIGFAGTIDRTTKKAVYVPHLPEWAQKPLAESFEESYKCPVFLENDTALSGLGEAFFGAGSSEGVMVYVTISTGVGGVRIVDGDIDRGRFSSEPGHQIVNFSDRNTVGGLGGGARLEDLIAGTAIEKKFNTKAYEITDDKVWDDMAKFLAYGLHNMVLHWSPERIVLGGAQITGQKGRLIDISLVKKYLKEGLYAFPNIPDIVPSKLREETGLWGGLAFLQNNLENISN